jgi:[acyl-carrier-protein] S-malonyltransferase
MALAFVFPGQGSQAPGMGRDLAAAFPAAREVFGEVDDALKQKLAKLMFEGPAEELTLTANAQPALMAHSMAVLRVLEVEGGFDLAARVALVAGHSLGEYSALVAAGALSFAEALPLVRFRAQAMQEAVPVGTGAMAAILGLEAGAVIEGCTQAARELGTIVQAANFNDPKQTVIAGTKAGVDKACELLKAAGAKRALPLAVSAPFHSALMKPAAERLRERLATTPIDAPFIPVIDNIDVRSESEPAAIRDALYRQAFGAVRWVETVQAIRARGITHIFECGPGRVLAGLVKRIEPEAVSAAVSEPESLAAAAGLLR